MHLSESEVAALAHGETSDNARREAMVHLATCPACTENLDEFRITERRIDDLLRTLDHTPPIFRVNDVTAEARRRERRWLTKVAAGITIFLATAAVATAFPNSPLRALVRGVFGTAVKAPGNAEPQTRAVAPPSASASIAILPSDTIEIWFDRWQQSGTLQVRVTDGAQLSLVPSNGNAAFSIGQGRIDVANADSATSFVLDVPRNVRSLRVHVGTALVFSRTDRGVSPPAQADSAGSFSVNLFRPKPRARQTP